VDEARGTALGGHSRLRVLDGLRLVAALAVVGFHFTGRDSDTWSESVRTVFPFLSRFTIYGGFGPYLFFIISGFVVLMSAWGRSVPAFVGSRVGRLYPAYWVAVVLTAVVMRIWPLVPDWQGMRAGDVALNMTMFQSAFGVGHVDGVYWTLWAELKFYLLLLAVMALGITRARLLALCLAWPVVGALSLQAHSELLTEVLQPYYAPFFCIGILLYLVHREGWTRLTALLLGLNYTAALWSCSAYYIPWSERIAGAPVSFRGLALLLTLCIAAVVVATLTPVARIDWRWLTVAGALTYPLYLVHQHIGWVLLHGLSARLPTYVNLALVVLVMIGLAYAVHRVVERPLGRLLRTHVERELTALTADPAGRRGMPRLRRHDASHPHVVRRRPQPEDQVRAADDTVVLVPSRRTP
jgi:peptidoglycan/LPS O-acetylase OafA/YrhL